eukprot:scaffold28_cov515-Prasinococcus_capsulatus_cf.AAC.3
MADDPRDRPRAEECAAMLLCVVDGQGEAEARQQAGYRRVEELHASMLGRKQQQQQRQQQQQQQQQQQLRSKSIGPTSQLQSGQRQSQFPQPSRRAPPPPKPRQ